jgi:hypothetical protein
VSGVARCVLFGGGVMYGGFWNFGNTNDPRFVCGACGVQVVMSDETDKYSDDMKKQHDVKRCTACWRGGKKT